MQPVPPNIPAHQSQHTLRSLLFGSRQPLWAVIDADHCPQLLPMLERHPVEHACLFGGHFAPAESSRSPHLVRMEPASPLADWLLTGWGRRWGIYALSSAPLQTLREHFRSFLVVLDPAGNPLFFRYYDPTVMGVYLPTLNPEEAAAVFGPVAAYIFEEEETAQILRFTALKTGKTKFDKVE
jgi:hypothetical protein